MGLGVGDCVPVPEPVPEPVPVFVPVAERLPEGVGDAVAVSLREVLAVLLALEEASAPVGVGEPVLVADAAAEGVALPVPEALGVLVEVSEGEELSEGGGALAS